MGGSNVPSVKMPILRFLHVKLDVSDLSRSLAFYCGVMGFSQVVRHDRDDGVIIVQVSPDNSNVGIELWFEPPFGGFRNDRLHIALEVSDLDGLVQRLKSCGHEITRQPFLIGDERIAFIKDPDGYEIELNEVQC